MYPAEANFFGVFSVAKFELAEAGTDRIAAQKKHDR